MTGEPQKVSRCKFCSQEITWHTDPVTQKSYPKNLNGSAHLCKQGAAPVTDIAGDAVEKAKEKMAKAGFGQPAGEPKEIARPQESPADAGLKPDVRSGPKKIDGEIININPEKRNLALRSLDEKGYEITTLFVWRENRDLDQAAIKQKPGWYVTVTYEAQGEINHAQDIKYCDRPASMKKKTGYSGGSGKPYTPRNEKPMLYESVFKTLGEMFDPATDGKGKTFEENARRVWAMTEEIGDKMAGKSGVQ